MADIQLNRLYERSRARTTGGRPVFKHNAWNEQMFIGGVIAGDWKAGDKIFAGDFCYYDYKAHLVYPLKQFQLAADLGAGDTEVYFVNSGYSHVMRNDMFITAEPESATSTGKAVSTATLENTTLNGNQVYKLTITAGSLGTGSLGDLYVEADEAGTAVAPKITEINGILDDNVSINNTLSTVMGETYNSVQEITPRMHCTVLRDLVLVPKIAPESGCAVKEFYQL